MTFTTLMTTFLLTFSAIEFLLPRLYRREFVQDYDQLMANLEQELVNELQRELTFQMRDREDLRISLLVAQEQLDGLIADYEAQCQGQDHWWYLIEGQPRQVNLDDEDGLSVCQFLRFDIYYFFRLVNDLSMEIERTTTHESLEWFHLMKLRDHHFDHGSTAYLVARQILTNFATANNVRIWIWDIPARTSELGETLFYIEGRSPEAAEFMTVLDETELGVREQWYRDPVTGGFAIAVSGTFQPAYRVLGIISALGRQLLIVVFFVSLVVSYLFSRYLTRPIVALSKKSKQLRKLQFDEHNKINRRDEIGDLSSNLNFMSYELKRTLDLLQDANDKLKIEMEKEREQERQRRNLFTSISHELKTPLTILKGEIGGMIDQVGDFKDRDTYLNSAYNWVQTLEKLVSEILTISRLEGEKMRLNPLEIDLQLLIQDIYLQQMPLANKEKIHFDVQLDTDLWVLTDVAMLKIAISNIINNAIFYTEQNGHVLIKLKTNQMTAQLKVTNTGAFIEKEALTHLFDPFYRVERSRNRHTGGSGLGLFIVKNILELHEFEYLIENVEEGVCFTINFPLIKKK